ncbi:hypothetical protein O6H91_21G044000 [Diphasiastrum complanatum]|uniref:Uncharacterized protein n=1 Tax=Diphasiastrum complanatum TaxID=34168 RepID=A0ACC2AK94_DIPCM|nr:hypothetical protein O6H91_Y294800 [Diphasiastrum complanatum]KAJ7517876.1 hypothetical protein O6H91_21G044000 [Diphasiastrum complanatum]
MESPAQMEYINTESTCMWGYLNLLPSLSKGSQSSYLSAAMEEHQQQLGRWRSCKDRRAAILLLLLTATAAAASSLGSQEHSDDESDGNKAAVERLRQYLRFPTVHPDPDLGTAVQFLLAQAASLALDTMVKEFVPKKPVVLLTWRGDDPSLPSILLNSHMDVVPVEVEHWKYDPFGAFMDSNGDIHARGAQDMKSVGVMYLEAIRNLKKEGFRPLRDVHLSFVPDEEVGGADGFGQFSKSEEFRNLNIAVGLDEGSATDTERYRTFTGEKSPWWLSIKAVGNPGHGSKLYDNSPVENLLKSIEAITNFRTSEFDKIKFGKATLADVVSVNPVFLKAGTPTPTGFVMNLQPSEAEAGFDIRLPPFTDRQAIERRIADEWAPAFRNMTYKFILKSGGEGNASAIAAESSKLWWGLFETAMAKAGVEFSTPEILYGFTDARYVRDQGIPALGFSPIANTIPLLHDRNEYVNVKEFLRGIKVYEEIFRIFSSHKSFDHCSEAANSQEFVQFV